VTNTTRVSAALVPAVSTGAITQAAANIIHLHSSLILPSCLAFVPLAHRALHAMQRHARFFVEDIDEGAVVRRNAQTPKRRPDPASPTRLFSGSQPDHGSPTPLGRKSAT
jgi:hypothetical protein